MKPVVHLFVVSIAMLLSGCEKTPTNTTQKDGRSPAPQKVIVTADARFGSYFLPPDWQSSAQKIYIGDFRQLLAHGSVGAEAVEVRQAHSIAGPLGTINMEAEVIFSFKNLTKQPHDILGAEAFAFDSEGRLSAGRAYRPSEGSKYIHFDPEGMEVFPIRFEAKAPRPHQIALLVKQETGNAVFIFMGIGEAMAREWNIRMNEKDRVEASHTIRRCLSGNDRFRLND